MNHSVRACVKNTAKTAIVSLMIMLTACSTVSGNNAKASSDKKYVVFQQLQSVRTLTIIVTISMLKFSPTIKIVMATIVPENLA